MGIRYTPEQLTRLRESPLVERPLGLPPAEEWMGPPSDNIRNQSKATHHDRASSDRSKLPLLDQTNRRPALERHISRSTANPEDIILGPPKTSFASATSLRNNNKALDAPDRPSLTRDPDSRDRYSSRRVGDAEDERNGRSSNLRTKRGEGDQDSDGWSTVKPRKSFGTEGAERFNGRMGGDRRFRDRDDRENKERPPRGFDTYSRDRDADPEQEGGSRRNGAGRGRNEPSWFKENTDTLSVPGDRKSNGDKHVDRSRGWREKEREDKAGDRGGDRNDDRGDRRWERDKDKRQERDPEWMDEPAEEKKQAHTQEDFQKWKERMKAGNGNTPAEEVPPKVESAENGGQSSFFGLEKPKVEPPLIMDTGPDKFFGLWAQPKQDPVSDAVVGSKKEGLKTATVGKSSRFTSFFAPQEDPSRRQTEPPPMPAIPHQENNAQSSKDKEDFQRLLQKLQSQSFAAPPSSASSATAPSIPKQPPQEKQQIPVLALQDTFQQYRSDRSEPPRSATRDSQQALQDLLGQRQTSVSQPSSTRPEQVLQELVNQRQSALSQSSSRPEQVQNRNAAFLMGLMQNAREAPEPMRVEQIMTRHPPQAERERQMQQQVNEREQEMQRERERPRQRRPDLPPGFYDEALFQRGPQPQHEGNPLPRSQAPPQPTQILQRPPPGLDQLPPSWGAPNTQLPPPMSQQRHIAPPPGLPGAPQNRGMPMPQNMFPPGFPIGAGGFGPPPDGMIGAGGPRNMGPPPPPGFMMPPPGFMGGPPMNVNVGVNAFQQGPPEMGFGPFDARGQPQGGYRRQ